MQLAKVIAAVKSSPNHRAMVGDLEVLGSPGRDRWSFNYIIRTVKDGKTRVAYGRANAERYVDKLPNDSFINTNIAKFVYAAAPVEPEFKGHDAEGLATFKLPFTL